MDSFTVIYSIVLLQMVLLFHTASTKKYCRQDRDCTHLGKLTCIKSICNWGICGCPNNYASRYLGQKKGFECVEMKKIGDKCSNRGDKGVCAADNSHCSEEEDKCVCDTGNVAIWGGERCEPIRSTGVGETCSSSTSIGSCGIDSSSCTSGTGSYYHTVAQFDVPTCACPNDHYLGLSNIYTRITSTSTVQPFPTRVQPQCVPILHGDSCLKSSDCGGLNMQCNPTTFVCECDTAGYVPNYDRTICDTALAFGASCASVSGHCDGSLGLMCGDVCALTGTNELSDSTRTCTCGPFHKVSGTACTAIGSGSTCYGDYNCKLWSLNGVCDNGVCVQGAADRVLAAGVTLLLALATACINY